MGSVQGHGPVAKLLPHHAHRCHLGCTMVGTELCGAEQSAAGSTSLLCQASGMQHHVEASQVLIAEGASSECRLQSCQPSELIPVVSADPGLGRQGFGAQPCWQEPLATCQHQSLQRPGHLCRLGFDPCKE